MSDWRERAARACCLAEGVDPDLGCGTTILRSGRLHHEIAPAWQLRLPRVEAVAREVLHALAASHAAVSVADDINEPPDGHLLLVEIVDAFAGENGLDGPAPQPAEHERPPIPERQYGDIVGSTSALWSTRETDIGDPANPASRMEPW